MGCWSRYNRGAGLRGPADKDITGINTRNLPLLLLSTAILIATAIRTDATGIFNFQLSGSKHYIRVGGMPITEVDGHINSAAVVDSVRLAQPRPGSSAQFCASRTATK